MKYCYRFFFLLLMIFTFLSAQEKKKALVEYVGSTQCPYCPQVTVLLDQYQNPSHANYFGKDIVDDMVVVRYHTYNPGYGDPLYATIGGSTCETDFTCVRINGEQGKEWYAIGGVPTIFIDGQNTNNYLTDVKATQTETTPVKISLEGSTFNDLTINAKVTITSATDLSSDPLYLFVMATMDSVHYAGANGETEHEQVFLGFMGDTGPGLGKAITLNNTEAVEWTHTWTLPSDYPNEANGRNLGAISDWNTTVWDKKNMNLVAFIQNKTTLEVVQTEMISRRTMPVSQPPVVTAIDDITIDEDDDKTLYITATDADGDSLTYSATADTSAIVVMVGALSDNELYVSPLMNWNGSSVVTVAVSDGFSTVEESFTLTVNPTPDPPGEFTWTNPTVENDSIAITSSNGDFEWSLDWEKSMDPDGEDVTYMIYSTLPPFNTVPLKRYGQKESTTSLTFTYQNFIDSWPSDLQMVNRLTYVYNVFAYSGNDSTEITGTRQLVVKREGDLNTESIEPPNSFVLHPNYPNPFNPQTQIRFEMPYAGKVDLSIYNLLGVKIKTLYSGQKPTGVYTFKWDGKNESSQLVSGGVYIYKLQSEKGMQMRKMILLK